MATRESIQTIYNNMWLGFEAALQQDELEADPLIGNENDNRRGITALAYLDKNDSAVCEKIGNLISEVSRLEPAQYFYPANELHLTVLSIVSCAPGFKLEEVNSLAYGELFQQALQGLAPFKVHFRGVTASPAAVVIQGFPLSNQLGELRDRLRKLYGASSLRTSMDRRYKLEGAHATAVRFRHGVSSPDVLKLLLESYRNYDFGVAEITSLDLVFNNWYQNLVFTHHLEQGRLGAER
jgi:2'-5' RNA ligase